MAKKKKLPLLLLLPPLKPRPLRLLLPRLLPLLTLLPRLPRLPTLLLRPRLLPLLPLLSNSRVSKKAGLVPAFFLVAPVLPV